MFKFYIVMAKEFREVLQKLRKKLPRNYTELVAQKINVEGYDATKVLNVFMGRVTDMVSVGLVVAGAKDVIADKDKIILMAKVAGNKRIRKPRKRIA